jgi:hypothetical protein
MTDPNIEALAHVTNHLVNQVSDLSKQAATEAPHPPAVREPVYEDYYPEGRHQ